MCYPCYYPSSVTYPSATEEEDLNNHYEALRQQAEREKDLRDALFGIYRNAFEDFKYELEHQVYAYHTYLIS